MFTGRFRLNIYYTSFQGGKTVWFATNRDTSPVHTDGGFFYSRRYIFMVYSN